MESAGDRSAGDARADAQRFAGAAPVRPQRWELPFEEPPFEKLVSHEALSSSALCYQIINKAHHRPMDVTPQDAADVNSPYEGVSALCGVAVLDTRASWDA